jgi:hypothetical protein
MDRGNRLIWIRIREIRRQITINNVIILLIITYFIYSYYNSPLITKPARKRNTTSHPIDPSIAAQINSKDIESCWNACGKIWKECHTSCRNRELKCFYSYGDEEYDDIECDDDNNNLSPKECFKSCNHDRDLCIRRCSYI